MPFSGRCHCGSSSFTVSADIPERFVRCTCSFCSKRGALHAYFPPDQVDLKAEADGIYRWGTHRVDHHFCLTCGCAVWSDSPAFEMDGSWDGHTRRWSINARLIDGIEAAEWPVDVIDGKSLW